MRLAETLLGGVLSVLLAMGPALAEDHSLPARMQQWDLGLRLLDSGQTAAAADHFYAGWAVNPDGLEFLDGCLRVEERRAHADSVLPLVQARLAAASGGLAEQNLAGRYLAAQELRSRGHLAAAADSFQALAQTCLDRADPFSAHLAALKAARCRVDDGSAAGRSRSSQELLTSLARLPGLPRLHWETELQLANLHFKADELIQAEEIYRNLLVETTAEDFPSVRCDAVNALGSIMAKQRHLAASVEYYQAAVALARSLGDRRRLSLLLGNLGYQETNLRDFPSAEEHLSEAEQIASRWGYRAVLGPIKAGQGAVSEMTGDRVEAVSRFRAAIELSQTGGNQMAELGARQRLGYNLTLMGEYTEARRQFTICLDLLERSGGRFILNWVLGGLALTNHKLGYLDQAAEYYRQAHAVNLEMGDLTSAAWCLNSLGVIEAQEGDYRQALVTNHLALDQYQALADREGEGDVRASMAEIYLQLGDYHQALQQSQQALSLARQVNSQELLRRAAQAMASAYSATGQTLLAEQNYRLVLEIARGWSDRVVEIWALNELAGHYLDTDRSEEARGYLRSALELLKDEDYYHVRSATFLNLARASENADEAAAWAGQALDLATAGGLPDREWNALSDLGWYRLQQGKGEEAEELQLRSIQLVESLRRRAGADELRRCMLRPALKPYERLIELYVDRKEDPAAAFTISERSRAQILAGRLQAAQGHLPEAEVRATDPEERDLTSSITYLQSRLQDAELTATVRDSLRRQISVLEGEFQLLKLRWSPGEELEGAVLYPDPPRLKEMLAFLGRDEHVLSYFLGEDQAYLFSVNRDGVKAYRLGDAGLITEKAQLYLRLQRYGAGAGAGLPPAVLLEARQELYRLLVAPARQDIRSGSTLVIVPDGVLHRLPFAYLQDGEEYLVVSGGVFTVPSLQVLGYLRQRGNRDPSQRPTGVLAIGCAEAAARVHPFNDQAITRLPHADEEAWRLARLFADAVILTGTAANEQKIRSGVLAAADIVHFAAHSYVDQTDFRHSYIVLNRNPESEICSATSRSDGLLQWYEIVNLELHASLVALASCRSAGGSLTTGEGITGLTQAFLYAGSRGVLATLTDVPDQDTGWVMDRFYEELSRGATAAAALRSAQLAGLGLGTTLGAEFVMVGDGALTWNGSAARERPTRFQVAVGLFLLLGAVMVGLRPR